MMMGLSDIVKKRRGLEKRSKLPQGEQISAGTKEEFRGLCKSLTWGFRGVMRLYSELDGKAYTAALLLEKGDIIATSFEDANNKTIIFGKEAIVRIKERLSGTTGDLEVYTFSDKDMEKVKEGNVEALLDQPVNVSYLGMKIKSEMETETEEIGFGSFWGGKKPEKSKIRELKTGDDFNLVDFARKFPGVLSSAREEGMQLDGGEIPKDEGTGIEFSDLKKDRLTELKRKRHEENLALRKRMSQIGKKKYDDMVKDGGKVKTSIDELYQLVQEHNKLRIDNKLARKLGTRRSQIENWAMILEEHDLVELHYPAIGEPEIRKIRGKT